MKPINYSECHPIIGENFNLQKFIDGKPRPKLPFAATHIFKGIQDVLGGLFVDCGRIWLKNNIEYLFQEFETGEGWIGFDLLYCRLRFNHQVYVTIIVWDKGIFMIPVICQDQYGLHDLSEDLNQDQIRIAREIIKIIHASSLPNPPITYEIK